MQFSSIILLALTSLVSAAPSPAPIAQTLSSYNNWMSQYSSVIGARKIYQIDIPGAHHGGLLSFPWYEEEIALWSICQSSGITSLLNSGIRYLDLRIGEKNGAIYFSHTFLGNEAFTPALNEILNWVKANPTELLILDIENDGGYSSNTQTAMNGLAAQLSSIYGSLLMNLNQYQTMTYSQLIASGKRIAVVGDSRFNVNNIPKISGWGTTQSSIANTMVANIAKYIPTTGRAIINAGIISVSSASITPVLNESINLIADLESVSPPILAAGATASALESSLPAITGRIGVIEMDFVNQQQISVVISHNQIN